MKPLRLAITCLAIAANILCAQLPPSLAGAKDAATASAGTIEKILMGAKWDVDTERGQRPWGDLRFREGHEFSTMEGPNGQWKVTGERKVALGSLYVLEFAPGLESFVATRNDGVKIAAGKRKAATPVTDSSVLKTAPAAPATVTQVPLPSPLTPRQQTAQRHAQEVATQIATLQAPFTMIAAEAEKAGKDVTANYLSALDQLQGQKAATGDIDGVVAIKEERDRVVNRQQPTAAQLQAMSAPVGKLRAAYEADTKKAADEAARRNDLAYRSYLANLEGLQKRMNTMGEIEQGLLVKAEKDRFIAEIAAGKSRGGTSALPARIGFLNNAITPSLKFVSVTYQGRNGEKPTDVTARLKQLFESGIESTKCTPWDLGTDPLPGYGKALIINYSSGGQVQQKRLTDHDTLNFRELEKGMDRLAEENPSATRKADAKKIEIAKNPTEITQQYVGKWNSSDGGLIVVNPDHTTSHGRDNGTWEIRDGSFNVKWSNGYRHRISLGQTGDKIHSMEISPKGKTKTFYYIRAL